MAEEKKPAAPPPLPKKAIIPIRHPETGAAIDRSGKPPVEKKK